MTPIAENICPCSEIEISYNKKTFEFSVFCTETQCGYFVDRQELAGDYRNSGELTRKILECGFAQEIPDDEVFVSVIADKEMILIWEANIVLF